VVFLIPERQVYVVMKGGKAAVDTYRKMTAVDKADGLESN